jgi:hypothetical protein
MKCGQFVCEVKKEEDEKKKKNELRGKRKLNFEEREKKID